MAVLVVDTASQVLAVAAGTDQQLLGTASFMVPRGHSVLLQPTMEYVLRSAGLRVNDISLMATGVGPGSYTGVRMAVATTKTMALALGVPVVPVSSLWALAEAACPHQTDHPVLVMPLLYARRQRAFGAVYEKSGHLWRCVVPDSVQTVEHWAQTLLHLRDGRLESDVAVADVVVRASGALPEPGMPRENVIVHDFVPHYGVLELIRHASSKLATLSDVAGGVGAALWKLAVQEQHRALVGDAVHQLTPNYALQVEAEAKMIKEGRAE